MIGDVHIHAVPFQPLTRYQFMGRTFINKMNRRFRCHKCRAVRCAKSLEVAMYYDMMSIRCRGGCPGRNKRK